MIVIKATGLEDFSSGTRQSWLIVTTDNYLINFKDEDVSQLNNIESEFEIEDR